MVNPIGLEDWKALGAPYRTVDQWYQRELKLNADGLRKYEQSTYYVGRWKPEYDRWVTMLAGLNHGPGHAPQMEQPAEFHKALLQWLAGQ